MLAFSALDEEQYDLVAGVIIYGKLMKKLAEDFVMRKDMQRLFMPQNILVQVAVPAGTGSVTKALYDGTSISPLGQIVKEKRIAEKEAGRETVEGLTSGIKTVAGD